MLRRKIERSFGVIKGVKGSNFNISFGLDSITLIGPANDREVIVIGTKKGIKHFTNQHHNLIKDRK